MLFLGQNAFAGNQSCWGTYSIHAGVLLDWRRAGKGDKEVGRGEEGERIAILPHFFLLPPHMKVQLKPADESVAVCIWSFFIKFV